MRRGAQRGLCRMAFMVTAGHTVPTAVDQIISALAFPVSTATITVSVQQPGPLPITWVPMIARSSDRPAPPSHYGPAASPPTTNAITRSSARRHLDRIGRARDPKRARFNVVPKPRPQDSTFPNGTLQRPFCRHPMPSKLPGL